MVERLTPSFKNRPPKKNKKLGLTSCQNEPPKFLIKIYSLLFRGKVHLQVDAQKYFVTKISKLQVLRPSSQAEARKPVGYLCHTVA